MSSQQCYLLTCRKPNLSYTNVNYIQYVKWIQRCSLVYDIKITYPKPLLSISPKPTLLWATSTRSGREGSTMSSTICFRIGWSFACELKDPGSYIFLKWKWTLANINFFKTGKLNQCSITAFKMSCFKLNSGLIYWTYKYNWFRLLILDWLPVLRWKIRP